MTIRELYEWAEAHDALDLEIDISDICNDLTTYIYPEIEIRWDNYKVQRLKLDGTIIKL